MHVLMAVEGYADETGLLKFEKEWHGKEYANGKAKLRVRKVEFYTLACNEIGREELISDLLALTGGNLEGSGGNNSDGAFRWDRAAQYARTIGKFFGVKKIDSTNIPINKKLLNNHGLNCHFVVVGEVSDHKSLQGVEQV